VIFLLAIDVLDLTELEPNIPPLEFGVYCTSIAGPPGVGKSEFCTKYDKPFIFDFEEGTKGKVVFRVPVSRWIEVKKYIRQLVSKPELKNKFQTCAIDTVNYCLEACKQYIIDQYQADHPDKIIDTFNKIPYGGGKELLSKEFKGEINKLKRAGYGVILVSHIKDKVFDKETENEHTKTVPDLTDADRNMINAMADFSLLVDFETDIIEPAKKDSNGKVIKEAVVETKRVMYLRTNESAEAKFRWPNVPEKIDFDYDAFKQVFQEAVLQEIEQGKKKFGLSDEKIEEIKDSLSYRRENEQEETIKEEQEKDKLEKEQESLEFTINSIMELAKELKGNGVDIKEINKVLGGDPRKLKDIEEARTTLKNLRNLK